MIGAFNCRRAHARRPESAQKGTALIVAILVVFVLSVLGLALMLSTSVESDLSVNHRWGEMAFFNAEAGLEFAKNVLAGYAQRDGDFSRALPPARTQMNLTPENPPPCEPATAGCRDYQYSLDNAGTVLYIGRVLRDRTNGRLFQFDFRDPGGSNDLIGGDLNGDGVPDVQGTVTIWVRRPVVNGVDYAQNDQAVVTAEGTAPNYDSPQSGRQGAIHRLEFLVALGSQDAAGPRNAYKTRDRITDGSDTANLSQQRTITEGQ